MLHSSSRQHATTAGWLLSREEERVRDSSQIRREEAGAKAKGEIHTCTHTQVGE